MNQLKVLKTILSAAITLTALPAFAAGSEYLWSDDKGAVSAEGCVPAQTPAAEVPFKVLYKTRGEAGDYVSMGKDQRLLLKNLSLITLIKTNQSTPAFTDIIKVISAPPRVSYSDDGSFAGRGTQGYLNSQSLRPVGDFTLLITGASAKVTGGSVTRIGGGQTLLAGSRWKLALYNGNPIVYTCPANPNAKYFAFDVTAAGEKAAVLRVGVKFSETQIFSTASVDIAALQEAAAPPSVWTDITRMMGWGDLNVTPDKPSRWESTDNDEIRRDSGEEDDDDTGPAPKASTGGEVQPVEGSSRMIICDGDGINVRDEKISAQEIFKSRPFERIFVKVPFGKPASKQGVVKGKTFTFKEVQFIDRVPSKPREDISGWINQDFISTEANCKAFQDSLKNVVCIKSGQQWVRDANNEELFPLKPLEDIIRKPDWKRMTDKRTIDGKSYDFIPVIVPSENNAEGWIALDALLPEADCITKREEMMKSAKAIGEPGCCSFPLTKNPKWDYEWDRNFNRWFGGKRPSGRLHAACDLFQDPGSTVQAVTAGVVDSDPAEFTRRRKSGLVSYEFSVKHTGGKIIRYGEITGIPSKMRKGKTVAREDKLGVVSYTQMLHLEMYKGTGTGPLTVYPAKKNGRVVEKNKIVKDFLRRSDLMDPTKLLIEWELNSFNKRTTAK